jgi:hypothetical protein
MNVVVLANRYSDDLPRILLSSKEMAKACISYVLGKENLANGDLLSAGVNFYYSLFHSCLSVISSTTNAIPIEKCVAEFKNENQLPKYYVPLSHKETVLHTMKQDQELANELQKLMRMREYLSYGPNVLYEEEQGKVRIDMYTRTFKGLPKEIRQVNSRLPNLIGRCCELLKIKLNNYDFPRFLLYFYIATDMICKDLHYKGDFIERCYGIINSFDEGNTMRDFFLRLRIPSKKNRKPTARARI